MNKMNYVRKCTTLIAKMLKEELNRQQKVNGETVDYIPECPTMLIVHDDPHSECYLIIDGMVSMFCELTGHSIVFDVADDNNAQVYLFQCND